MSEAIEWRPLPVVSTRSDAKEAFISIKNGEHFGIFIPSGCELAVEMDENFDNQKYVPFLARAAKKAGLLDKAKFRNRFDIGDDIETRHRLQSHADLTSYPYLNIHLTKYGRVLAMLMKPQSGFIDLVNSQWRQVGSDEYLTRFVRSGCVDDNYIDPVVEIAIAGPGDRVAFMETPPLAEGVLARPVPHWFYSLSFARSSAATLYH